MIKAPVCTECFCDLLPAPGCPGCLAFILSHCVLSECCPGDFGWQEGGLGAPVSAAQSRVNVELFISTKAPSLCSYRVVGRQCSPLSQTGLVLYLPRACQGGHLAGLGHHTAPLFSEKPNGAKPWAVLLQVRTASQAAAVKPSATPSNARATWLCGNAIRTSA